eukprot:1072468-Prymnesium_polylepis.1
MAHRVSHAVGGLRPVCVCLWDSRKHEPPHVRCDILEVAGIALRAICNRGCGSVGGILWTAGVC